MPDVFTEEASDDYLELTIASRNHGIIGRRIFLARLELLVLLGMRSHGPVAYANSLLQRVGHVVSQPTRRDSTDQETRLPPPEGITFGLGGARYAPPALQEFGWLVSTHQSDVFPSLPFGFRLDDELATLDLFLGWQYSAADQVGRLDAFTHARLWNDSRFRSVVAEAFQRQVELEPRSEWRLLR